MAWNTGFSTKAAYNLGDGANRSKVSLGAPIANNPAYVGRGYSDNWDIEKAMREGMKKITWVFRCVDVISGNQARLPIVLKKDPGPMGELVQSHRLLTMLNSKTNIGENSFAFRYRVSAQFLLSTRGVFIEKVYGKDGGVIALQLLPPQHTKPIPHPRTFVSGYEVELPDGNRRTLNPDDVIWIRHPHPLDPYLSLTPMEASGVAIEIEALAKLYNRNFLLNDGRPGGLLVVRGYMDDEDKDELKSRFRANAYNQGGTTVLASEDGVDYVDTAANPRDAAYMQMRQLTKEEIFSAFGVPESVIANASGRTFSNASEEIRVFWMETMLPHLEPIARGLDELDDQYFIEFDTANVPIMIIARQERSRYHLDEFIQGTISSNEYRELTGRARTESELADSLLVDPNRTPYANTEKPFEPEQQASIGQITSGEVPGAAPGGALPGAEVPAAPDPLAAPAPAEGAPAAADPFTIPEFETAGAKVATKVAPVDDDAIERWSEIIGRGMERLFERQQRVVMEKATGQKSRRSLEEGSLKVESIFDIGTWNRQLREDLKPIIKGIMVEAAESVNSGENTEKVSPEELEAYAEEHVEHLKMMNSSTKGLIAAAIASVIVGGGGESAVSGQAALLGKSLESTFGELIDVRRKNAAEGAAVAAWNAGIHASLEKQGDSVMKVWRSVKDEKVRREHRDLDGKAVPITQPFEVDGQDIRFPGDPLAPLRLTANCRCRLTFRQNT